MKSIDLDRLEVANKVLSLILPKATVKLLAKGNTLYITTGYHHEPLKERRVRVKSDSDYFYGDRCFPSGGTHQRATVELIRWVRGKPENDLRLWKHWCSPEIGIKPNSIIEILLEAGYPEQAEKGYWAK